MPDNALSWRARLGVGVAFAGLIGVLLRPTLGHLAHDVPANLGDPVFVAWVLRSSSHALVHHPLHLFDANIFWPHDLTLAYSESMLSVSPVYGVWYWITGNWTAALDLTLLSLVALNLGATFTLVRWLTGRTDAAIVAAVGFGFGGYVFAHIGHIQLLTLGFFPLCFLLLGKVLERRRTLDAVYLGVASGGLVLACLYYGAIYFVVLAVILGGYVLAKRFRPGAGFLRCLVVTGAVGGLLIAPAAIAYLDVQNLPGFERDAVPEWGFNPVDLRYPAAGSYVYGDTLKPPKSVPTPWEHTFFPGFAVMGLAAVGVAGIATSRGRAADAVVSTERALYAALLIVGGVTAAVLALGPEVHGRAAPFAFFHDHVPGFGGMRVTSRLAVVTLLAIAVAAGCGYAWLAKRFGWNAWFAATIAVGIVAIELAAPVQWARLPTDRDTLAVYRQLDKQPAGAVVELPMYDPVQEPLAWAFVEAPRMLYSTIDFHPRVNGYSSLFLPDYPLTLEKMAGFPHPDAIARLRHLKVRYVILHVGAENGYPGLDDGAAHDTVAQLPKGTRATLIGRAYLIDLAP